MATVNDVAAYILKLTGRISAMKFQKLVYYCQAWSLVWDEKPLFSARIEAWANGPVIPQLYAIHRGEFKISNWDGNPDALAPEEKKTVEAVVDFYNPHSAQALSDLTHREKPWREARQGLTDGERGEKEITLAALAEYYGGL
jgi:uncharacterized phage-associated protein